MTRAEPLGTEPDAADVAAGTETHAPGAEEVLRLMAERAALSGRAPDQAGERVGARAAEKISARRGAGSLLAPLGLGAVAGLAIAAALIGFSAKGLSPSAVILAAGAAGVIGVCIAAATARLFAPTGHGSAKMRRAAAGTPIGRLAGADALAALGLADGIIECDPDARLVTRRDGVVVYANEAYGRLATEAGVIGPAGLPPRIDRLFAQQGAEASKVFRLCRAAKSGAPAEEIVYQRIGLDGGGVRRRFEVTVRPVPHTDDFVSWRLRDLPVEEERHDALAAAYADYVRGVFAIEKSGQIAWANQALRADLGLDRAGLNHVDDFVLGETGDLVRALLKADGQPVAAKVRGRDGEPADAKLRAFRRGGIGEGFVCVDFEVEARASLDDGDPTLAGEIADAPFGVAIIEGEVGGDARVVEVNKAFSEMFGGVKRNAPLARLLEPAALEELAAEIRRKAASGGAPRPIEAAAKGAGGYYAVYARPARRRRGGYGGRRTAIYVIDVSDRKAMEAGHHRDQKLAALGRLTGEIAHDFNNFLQVVLGNCERLMLRHPAGDPDFAELRLIRENVVRASGMIRQLSAFSRNQTLQRRAHSITEILREWARVLDCAVGEKVAIEFVNGRGLPPVRIDRSQLENALMNLAVNARDAMGPSGGKLTIRTAVATSADLIAAGVPDFGPGEHLAIEVSDTGPGVPPDIRDKIFEPFFTTKEEGKGTGLGLSTVYGIVTQMDGAIAVGDAPGGGAMFRIFLPGCVETASADTDDAPRPAAGHVDLTGVGRILVVEDEDSVRNFVVTALQDCGYEVTTAADAEEALDLIAAEPGGYDVLVSDVMMPDIDGPTLVSRARAELGLTARVLFMSAYAESTVREQIDLLESVGYIQKPFTLKGLAAKVKETMPIAAPGAKAA